jgi:tetratricopeptide (TPR) repeat protein
MEHGRGLLTAYVLGLHCALEAGDAERALSCATTGTEISRSPGVLYKTIAYIKASQRNMDGDMIAALEYLKENFPKEPQWGERLGDIYFLKGNQKRVLSVLEPLIKRHTNDVGLRSFLLASESARLEGDSGMAVRFLERAHALYPKRTSILNNLIYNLARDPATVGRARGLLPGLLEQSTDSAAVLDTAAVVYLRSGDLKKAREFSDKALGLLKEGSYSALEIRLNAAEILFAQGELPEARLRAEAVRKDSRCSDFLDYEARQLLGRIEARLKARP